MGHLRRFVLAFVLFGLSGFAVAQESPPIRIGVVGTFSGGGASIDLSMRDAVRLAAKELNWKGGLEGRTIELVERDDAGDPDQAERGVRELLSRDKVEFAVGISNNSVALRVLQLFQDAKVPLLLTGATDSSLTQLFGPPQYKENYIFRLAPSDKVQAALITRELLERRQAAKVAVLVESSPYGRAGNDLVRDGFRKRFLLPPYNAQQDTELGWVRGDKVTMAAPITAIFQPGQSDMNGVLVQAKAAGATALVVWGQAQDAAVIAKARSRMGWAVPIIGGSPLATDAFIKAAGPAGQGVRMATTFVADPITPRRQEFLIALRKESGSDSIAAPMAAAQGYDALLLLNAATRQAGGTDRAAVRRALEQLKASVYGAVTTYEKPFTAEDHEAISADMLATGEVKGSRIVHAYREEVQSIIIGKRPAAAVPEPPAKAN